MVAGRLSIEDYKRPQSVSASNHRSLGNETSYSRWLINSLLRCYRGIDSPIFTFGCCKVKNFWTKKLGLESGILAWNPKSLMKNGGISNLTRDFNLVSGSSLVAISLATPCVKHSTGHRS